MGEWRTQMDKAERLFRTSKIVRKRIILLQKMYGNKEVPVRKIGRCRKTHPYDCGHPQCYCCHSDKLDKIPTKQQRASDLYLKEELT